MRSSYRTGIIACLIFGCFVTTSSADLFNKIESFNQFMIDPPTLHCLGFRWYIRGDDNGNATGELTYRKRGESSWKQALPMLRVNREVANYDFQPYACDNLFAGSIFNLEPDTDYEVRCTLIDTDSGEADTTVVVRTRAVPVVPAPLRTLHVYAKNAPDEPNVFSKISDVVGELKPGDLVLIHGGTHMIGPDGIKITISGIHEHPIVFRGAGDGESVIQAEYSTSIFNIQYTNHLFFENLIIRGGDRQHNSDESRNSSAINDTKNRSHAFFAEGASWLTVRMCKILNVNMGFYTYSEYSTNWYIADNVIMGKNPAWYPRGQDNPSHTGVNIYGRGHVVCHNKVSKFWDCLAIANYGKPSHDLNLQCVAIDFYNNDLSDAVDDGIEADYGCHNIRVFNNRIINAHTGLSAQPTYGGPIYFIRNELYNITSLSLKLHNWCTGLEIYHNTMVSARGAFRSYARWQNAVLRNNLFLGAKGYAVETGSPHPKTTLNYNGYYMADPERFIKWYDGENERRYQSLKLFSRVTGHEGSGVMVDYGIFVKASAPEEGKTYQSQYGDLELINGSEAVDAGTILPNINDDYTGKRPDIGCYEQGKPKPQYGPRR
ncbi:hypothetical protein ACFL47_07515 [Candidatus Latescibacterota bacterium]